MIYVHYNETTGAIIEAFHVSCPDIPTPHISVTEEAWTNAVQYQSRKIDISTFKLVYDTSELTKREINKQIAIIDSQIAELENKTYRPLREIALGLDSNGKAQTKLSELNSQITELRTQRETLAAKIKM